MRWECKIGEDGLLRLLEGTQSSSRKVAARIVVAGLLAAHPPARCTQLRAETALATEDGCIQPKGYQFVSTVVSFFNQLR